MDAERHQIIVFNRLSVKYLKLSTIGGILRTKHESQVGQRQSTITEKDYRRVVIFVEWKIGYWLFDTSSRPNARHPKVVKPRFIPRAPEILSQLFIPYVYRTPLRSNERFLRRSWWNEVIQEPVLTIGLNNVFCVFRLRQGTALFFKVEKE